MHVGARRNEEKAQRAAEPVEHYVLLAQRFHSNRVRFDADGNSTHGGIVGYRHTRAGRWLMYCLSDVMTSRNTVTLDIAVNSSQLIGQSQQHQVTLPFLFSPVTAQPCSHGWSTGVPSTALPSSTCCSGNAREYKDVRKPLCRRGLLLLQSSCRYLQ